MCCLLFNVGGVLFVVHYMLVVLAVELRSCLLSFVIVVRRFGLVCCSSMIVLFACC